MKAGWIVTVCVCLCADSILAQNLNNFDVQEPVLRFSPAAGEDEDLFGYAVTAHQIDTLDGTLTDPADIMQDALTKTRIIIGAPKGTFPGGLPLDDPGLPAAEQTGLVFSCPIEPGLCEGVRGNDVANVDDDDGISDGRLFDHRPPARLPPAPGLMEQEFENKTGQLLGAFLMSTGNNLLVCAHRWTTLVTQGSLPHGRCYFTDRDLTNVRLLQPCMSGRPIEAVGQAYCTAGTGAVMTDDLIAVGAPGFDQLSGVLYYTDDFVGSSIATMTQGNTMTPNATGSLVEINDIYTAFRVTSGQIANARGAGRPNIIATVPRYNQTEGRYGRVNVYDVPSPPMMGTDTFLMAFGEGEQIGEFFGHSVIAVDLDGDGYDDVVVGAPMYSAIDQARLESGRVYIFRNLRNSTLASEAVILEGQVSRGRFGSSLTSLGDVDNDGYEDFAVGAPYTTNAGTSNTGTVFIYYGRGDISRIADQEPFEVTATEMVSQLDGLSDLRTFGWSLSGGVDVDANGYNDLVIGAYESQAVFVIRSIPVADVYVELVPTLTIAGRINLEGGNTCPFPDMTMDYPCFPLTIRGNYTGVGLSEPLTITYTLREVVSSVQRMFFDMPGRPNELTGSLTFDTIGQEFATPDIMVLVFTREEISSLDTPLRLEVEVEQISRPESMGDGNQTVASLSDFPRVRQQGNPQLEVTLLTNCGEVCNADLNLQSVTPVFLNRDGSGTRAGFDADAVGSVNFTVVYANIAVQDAINNELSFVIPDIFETSVISTAECVLTGRSVVCDLRDVLSQRNGAQTVSIILTVDQSIMIEHNMQVDITFAINTIVSNDIDPSNNMEVVQLNIVVRADIFVTIQFATSAITYQQGLTNFPTERTTVDDLGMTDVVLNVTVGNDGPSIIQNAQLSIFFPAALDDILYLYPFDTLIPSQSATLTCDFSAINPDNLDVPAINSGNGRRRSLTSLKHKRRRREAIATLSRKPRQTTTNNPITTLDCSGGLELCSVIRCDIVNLATEASLDIIARVNEGFFTNQEAVFFLTAYSNVSITSTLEELTELPNNAAAQIVLTPPRTGDDDDNLIHAIIWPILGGLLLFVVFVLLLYFCGFFRRKKKPEDEVAEGDFDPNKFNVQPVETKKEEATTL